MKTGSLAELGAMPGMPSLPSLKLFIRTHADFPVIERGRCGVAYVLDLDRAAAFVREHWRDGRRLPEREEQRRADRSSPQLSLPGLDVDPQPGRAGT